MLAGLHLELPIFVAALAIPQPNLNPNPNRPNVAQTATITNCLLLLPAGGPRLSLPLSVSMSTMSLPGLGNPSIARYRDQEELCEILCNLLENFPLHSCTFSFTVLGLFISLMTINDATRLWKSKWKCRENEAT